MPRGAWIVHGRRNVMDALPMRWSVGTVRFARGGRPVPLGEEGVVKLVGGPMGCLTGFSDDAITIVPGDMDANAAAKQLATRFDIDIEAAQRVLPPGGVNFTEAR